jgi:3D (Asp-Asp-Asp) domain-containing protein
MITFLLYRGDKYMGKIGINLLKFIFAVIVLSSVSLYVLVSPSNEETYSTLKIFSSYNSIPYLNDEAKEVAMVYNASYDAIDIYKGTITAYGPDCIGCVSGLTSTGYKVGEVVNGMVQSTTITYTDKEYGKVRILAAAPSKFPYGTIIRVTGTRTKGEIVGIELDTGGAMRDAWRNGEVLIDL